MSLAAADPLDPQAVEWVLAEAVKLYGRVDGVANCVGSVILKSGGWMGCRCWCWRHMLLPLPLCLPLPPPVLLPLQGHKLPHLPLPLPCPTCSTNLPLCPPPRGPLLLQPTPPACRNLKTRCASISSHPLLC